MFTLCGQVPGQCRLLLHRYPNAALWSLKCPIKYSRCPIKYVQLTFSWSRQLKCFSLRVCNIIENISWTLKGTSSINNTRMPTGNKTAHLRVYYCTKNTSTGRRQSIDSLLRPLLARHGRYKLLYQIMQVRMLSSTLTTLPIPNICISRSLIAVWIQRDYHRTQRQKQSVTLEQMAETLSTVNAATEAWVWCKQVEQCKAEESGELYWSAQAVTVCFTLRQQ